VASRAAAALPAAVAAAAAAASAMSLVLGDDDLLREILLRLGLPTTLLRAALVSRRWLRHASDPAFLRAFRARHPPGLLGAYLSTADSAPLPRFLPTRPMPPEPAAVARRAGSLFDAAAFRSSSAAVRDCRGGRLLVAAYETHYGDTESRNLVCSSLSPAGGRGGRPATGPAAAGYQGLGTASSTTATSSSPAAAVTAGPTPA
jgi:hypothetical protein